MLVVVWLRLSGEARGRGWPTAAIVLVVAIGALVMLYPMFGLRPESRDGVSVPGP